jgi:C_GCAxxG_C_C family probable redox protein
MDRADAACELMARREMNCAQAVLSTYGGRFGLDREMALRLAQGFGSGMGRSGRTCGAVTAAYMVLGLSQKVTASRPREGQEATYRLIREFDRSFEVLHGSLTCRDLIGCDLGTLEGLAAAREKEIFTTVCPRFVKDAASILEFLLQLPQGARGEGPGAPPAQTLWGEGHLGQDQSSGGG